VDSTAFNAYGDALSDAYPFRVFVEEEGSKSTKKQIDNKINKNKIKIDWLVQL
jgi:hypothetical protein